MTREEINELREFKNEFILDYYGGEFDSWGDYLRYCDGQGFCESEILYDEVMFQFGKFKSKMCGLVGNAEQIEEFIKNNS